MVFSEGTTEKITSDTTGIDPGTVRIVAQRLNHYATPRPHQLLVVSIINSMLMYEEKICLLLHLQIQLVPYSERVCSQLDRPNKKII